MSKRNEESSPNNEYVEKIKKLESKLEELRKCLFDSESQNLELIALMKNSLRAKVDEQLDAVGSRNKDNEIKQSQPDKLISFGDEEFKSNGASRFFQEYLKIPEYKFQEDSMTVLERVSSDSEELNTSRRTEINFDPTLQIESKSNTLGKLESFSDSSSILNSASSKLNESRPTINNKVERRLPDSCLE